MEITLLRERPALLAEGRDGAGDGFAPVEACDVPDGLLVLEGCVLPDGLLVPGGLALGVEVTGALPPPLDRL